MEYFPLSRAQQRIYDLERFAGGAAGIAGSVLFEGALDEPAMQRALNLLTETNDALRLRITPQGVQNVTPYKLERFAVKTFENCQQFHDWAAQQALVPLDLHGTLYDFTIVEAGDCYGLFLCFHHIITDAWSAVHFVSLARQYYQDARATQRSSFLDSITKEQQYLNSEQHTRDRDFWLARFQDWPVPVFLAKQAISDMAAARLDMFLTLEEAKPLRDFAAAHGLSLFNLLSTAMAVYLYRLRGQREVCIGTTTLGRRSFAEKKTIGMFANTVPLAFVLDETVGFRSAMQAQKETLFSVIRHEGFGYPELCKALGGQARLYDVLVNYQNAAVAGMDETFAGTHWYFCGAQPETLQIQANDRDNTGGLSLMYDYQLAAFAQPQVQMLHERLMVLLHDAIANSEKPIGQLDILCESDKAAWQALNQSGHPVELKPVHCYFEAQAKAKPQATAVLFGEERLTYKELDGWASRIALYLQKRGAKPGDIVAVKLERCLELMPLLLGIMKAGCAYLPVLPAWPQARVDFVLKDAGARLLIDDPRALHDLPPGEFQSSTNPDLTAYVMYTSGSTGNPKGVRVGQGSLCNRLLWQQNAYPLAVGEILLQKTSIGFDVSAWELFWPFMFGCALLLPEPGAEREPRQLAALIAQHGIRTVHFVPSMLALFLDYMQASGVKLPSLEHVICSGEALTPVLNRRFYEVFAGQGARLINLYGPTECTVDVLRYDCKPDDEEIPIGKPVWNTQAYVLDQNGQLLPPGETGELCIAGVQLAQGYANPELDENRFVEHPMLGRLYKTGDMCSLNARGDILYHGREDGQVKINGQRVELGEIERCLEQVVARAAVLCDNEKLQAFVIAEKFDEQMALRYLRERLPGYMLPQRIVAVDEFPLNQNGKLDRAALAQLGDREQKSRDISETKLPATRLERQLMAAVHMQLGSTPGMDENPVRCGLSSLDMIGITTALEQQELRLRVADFYTAPNFAALAAMAQESAQQPPMILLPGREDISQVAAVGVPYGGGGFGAWADVARELPMPFYAVKTAHEDTNALLEELRQLPHARFVLMGSCVGSGLAAALAAALEKEGRLAGLCIVASVPPPMVRLYGKVYRPWRLRSGKGINRALRRLSARDLALGPREIVQLRADSAWFLRFLASARRVKLHAPVELIYGEHEPAALRKYAAPRWERLFGRPVAQHLVTGGKHDIVHTHPQEIARAVKETITGAG